MSHKRALALVGLVAVAALAVALAQDKPAKPEAAKGDEKVAVEASGKYKVDPIHSSTIFRIKHMNVAYFQGQFNEAEGTFVLDDDPTKCMFDVTLKVESVDSHNEARDKHLKSPDFFDAEKYPTIRFKSQSVKKTGDNALEAAGELTLHGVTKPLTVKIDLTGAAPGMKGEFRAGLETVFTVKRTDFGMDKMVGPVGDEVRLSVSIEGVRE